MVLVVENDGAIVVIDVVIVDGHKPPASRTRRGTFAIIIYTRTIRVDVDVIGVA